MCGLRDSVSNAACRDHAENAGGIPVCVILASQLVIAELAALRLHHEFNLGSFQIATIPRSRHGSVMVPYILTRSDIIYAQKRSM